MNVVEDGKGHVNELVNVIGYSMLAKFADKIEKVRSPVRFARLHSDRDSL